MDRWKKILAGAPPVLCLLLLFVPLCQGIAWCTGYVFTLYHGLWSVAVLAVLLGCVTVACLLLKPAMGKSGQLAAALLLPLSLLNAVAFLPAAAPVTWGHFLFLALSCLCAATLFFRCSQMRVLKYCIGTACAIFFALCLVALPAVLIGATFGRISSEAVVQTLPSPAGSYTAVVIDSDQGALGGNTFVEVRPAEARIKLLTGEFSEPPSRVYAGAYGEARQLRLSWRDEQTLTINGAAYPVEGDEG